MIAIDGPAGAGKSTLAAHLARRFGFLNLETGAMYRALALKAVEIRPNLRVLLSSGYARDALDESLSEARWPLLRKPYTKAELAERLKAQLGDPI